MIDRAEWVVIHNPRRLGDKRPWQLRCPLEAPEWAYYEQGWRCYCRRFRNKGQGERWIARHVFGEEPEGTE